MAWIKHLRQQLTAELFDNDGLDKVFSHARNVLTGAAVIAAGLYAAHHLGANREGFAWSIRFAGYAVATMGGVLLTLNLIDGLRRLAKRRHHLALRLAMIFVYVALSVRLTQVIIYFRSPL
jgi:hypothetical protein